MLIECVDRVCHLYFLIYSGFRGKQFVVGGGGSEQLGSNARHLLVQASHLLCVTREGGKMRGIRKGVDKEWREGTKRG